MPKLLHSPLRRRGVHTVIPVRQFLFPIPKSLGTFSPFSISLVVDGRNLGKMKARWGVSVPQLDNNDERFKSQQCEYLTKALGVWP